MSCLEVPKSPKEDEGPCEVGEAGGAGETDVGDEVAERMAIL